MKRNKNYILLFVAAAAMLIGACKKTDYTFGKIKTPSNVVISAAIQGAGTNPTGDGSGNVTVTVTATNALAYKIYWGTGDSTLTSTGTATYKYTTLDTNLYTVTVNAIGTAGSTTTASKQIKVLYQYQIPDNIIQDLTGGSTKNWMVEKDTVGNFGVGPNSDFTPDYYTAQPNEKPACAYAGIITFTLATPNSITINDNNFGSSFLIAASTAFYGQSGGDGCYVVNTGGTKTLAFGASNTGSSSSNSTGVVFTVPGDGLVDFGTGGVSYELLQLSPNVMVLRNIGIDGNAWYQILKANK
jgi:hypothetical protein